MNSRALREPLIPVHSDAEDVASKLLQHDTGDNAEDVGMDDTGADNSGFAMQPLTPLSPVGGGSAIEESMIDSAGVDIHDAGAGIHEDGNVDLALLSLAARPSKLDSAQLPKCLRLLGAQPMIGHVLVQLHAGGVHRVVLVLGARGDVIREAILALSVTALLSIRFVDLGPAYAGGFARSLLLARQTIGDEAFLLCTADHIFDVDLIRELRKEPAQWPDLDALALIERDMSAVSGTLPATAVRVRLLHVGAQLTLVDRIGTQAAIGGDGIDAIEAGIYRCRPTIFAALDELHTTTNYFTLAHAMSTLAASGRLGAVSTEGRAWFAIETPDQLQRTADRAVFHTAPGLRVRALSFPPMSLRKLPESEVPVSERGPLSWEEISALLKLIPKRGTAEYRFRDTVAYWISVCFIEGSLLFCIGAGAGFFRPTGWQSDALITGSYFSGGIAYLIGAYLGWYHRTHECMHTRTHMHARTPPRARICMQVRGDQCWAVGYGSSALGGTWQLI